MLPTAGLRLMYAMTNPPKPLGFDVIVNGKTIAVLDYEHVKKFFEKESEKPKKQTNEV